jgi:ubiquitin-protein ligase
LKKETFSSGPVFSLVLLKTNGKGGLFKVSLQFDESYPMKPPQVNFLNPVPFSSKYQPGWQGVCVWTSSRTNGVVKWMSSVCYKCWWFCSRTQIQILPSIGAARDLYRSNRAEYDRRARELIQK